MSDIVSVWKEVLPHETLVRFRAPHQQTVFTVYSHSPVVCVLSYECLSTVTVSWELRDVLFKKKKKTREREKDINSLELSRCHVNQSWSVGQGRFFCSFPFRQALEKSHGKHAAQKCCPVSCFDNDKSLWWYTSIPTASTLD